MRIFTAHLHARKAPVLVPEGLSWGGFLLGPLWLFIRGAWIAGAIVLALLVVVCTVAPPAFRPLLAFGLFAATGLFGNDLRRWSLGLARYRFAHVVAGRSPDEAFFRLLSAQPHLAGAAA